MFPTYSCLEEKGVFMSAAEGSLSIFNGSGEKNSFKIH